MKLSRHCIRLLLLGSALAGTAGRIMLAQTAHEKPVPKNTPATEQMLSSYEGQNVSEIDIAGRPDLQTSQFESLFSQKAGQPFSREKVEQTAAAIKAKGHFDDVRIEADPEAKGVRIFLILEPAAYFGIYQFPGSGQFPYSRLIQVANYPVQTPYSAATVERGRQRLLRFYQQEGYFQAQVKSEIKLDLAHSLVNVDFPAALGHKAKFGQVSIEGLPTAQQQDLEGDLKGLLARARQAAIRPGKAYHHSTLTRARQYLQTELEKRGLLGAQVELAGAEYHADTNRADIHFQVKPGLKTTVDIQGAHLWSWTKRSLLPMYQGVGVDPETVQEGRQALTSYFQGKGYFDVKVDSQMNTTPKGDTVLYQITKEKKHKVEEVTLKGNSKLKSDQLNPHIAVKEEHFLSSGKFSDQLMRNSVNNLKAVYRSEGFSSVEVVPTVTHKGGDLNITFTVTEGPRDLVHSLKVEGADTFPPSSYAPDGLKLAAGQPYSSTRIASDRATLMANYLKAGYLNASFRETASEVSKDDPHQIDVTYHIEEGPKVDTAEVLTLGRQHTRQRLIDKEVSAIRSGQPLTQTELFAAGSRLYDNPGVFDWAEVDPKRPITTQPKEDVLIKVHEGQKNTFTYGFGFEMINRGGSVPSGTVALPGLPPVGLPSGYTTSQTTFYGPRGTVQYTRNNVRGKAETISLTAFAGRLDQRFAFYYINPTFRWSPWRATTSLSYEKNEENPIFSSRQEFASLQLQRAIDHEQKNIVFARYSFTRTDLTRILIQSLVPTADQHVRLSTIAGNFTRDTRDNVLDEHRGVLDTLELDLNSSKLGSSDDFAKLTAQAAWYKQKVHNIVWAESIRIGLAQPFSNSHVPISEEFFTGGANSLRGFPLDSAGPQKTVYLCPGGASSCTSPLQITVPAGGNELLILNSEARIPLDMIKKNLSVVPFYDGGNVFNRVGFHNFTSLYANNIGVGFRYATPVGPVRIDFGYNLDPNPGTKAFQTSISIGQAF